MLEAAVKVITATLGPEARDIAPTSSLPAAEAHLLEACFAKYNLGAVHRLADIEGAVETLENALRSTRTCQGCDSVATMALQVVSSRWHRMTERYSVPCFMKDVEHVL